MAINIGDHVRVLPPFDSVYPEVYLVDEVNAKTGVCTICGTRQFDQKFLEVTLDDVTNTTYIVSTTEPVPENITKPQLRTWLKRKGHLATVETYLNSLPADDEIRIFWDDQYYLSRNSPALNALATQLLGMKPGQIDMAFLEASQILV